MSGKVIEVGDDNFESEILRAGTPALVDFWATWCQPCRAIGPVVAQLAEEYDGRVKFAKVNIDQHPATPSKYEVRSIPTLLLFKGGVPVGQVVGAVPKNMIVDLLKKAL
jgi:thioredoxin 1